MEEANKMDMKFEINLQQICLVKIASSLWENKNTKPKIQYFLQKIHKYPANYPEKTNVAHWNKVMKDVLSHTNNLPLPAKFRSKLKHVTRSLGLNIYSWKKYIKSLLPEDSTCIEDLFWTHYGTIDKVKIFKYWVEKKKLETTQLFNIACFFYLEEYIYILWNEIPEVVKKNEFHSKTIYEDDTYCHIAFWKNWLEGTTKNLENARSSYVSVQVNSFSSYRYPNRPNNRLRSSFEHCMLWVSLIQRHEFGVKYFWNKLDGEEDDNLKHFLRCLLQCQRSPADSEAILHLVPKLFTKDSVEFSSEECNFGLLMLLSNHPWDEFFVPVLERISKSYPTIMHGEEFEKSKLYFLSWIEKIVDLMKQELQLYGTVENSVYQNFLHETWRRIPDWAKFWSDDGWNDNFNNILSKLLLLEDFASLKLIVNANLEEFRKYRFTRLYNILFRYMKAKSPMRKEPRFEVFNRFLDEVELDEKDRNYLKTVLNQ